MRIKGYMKNYCILVYFSGYAVATVFITIDPYPTVHLNTRCFLWSQSKVIPCQFLISCVCNPGISWYIMVYRKMCVAEVLLIMNQSSPSLSLVRFNSLPKNTSSIQLLGMLIHIWQIIPNNWI